MEPRKKRLSERTGLKIFAAAVVTVMTLVFVLCAELTMVCWQNGVFFEVDHETLSRNVIRDIAKDATTGFHWQVYEALPDRFIVKSGDSYSVSPELSAHISSDLLPSSSNFIFRITDKHGRLIYRTDSLSAAWAPRGYSESLEYSDGVMFPVRSSEPESYVEYCSIYGAPERCQALTESGFTGKIYATVHIEALLSSGYPWRDALTIDGTDSLVWICVADVLEDGVLVVNNDMTNVFADDYNNSIAPGGVADYSSSAPAIIYEQDSGEVAVTSVTDASLTPDSGFNGIFPSILFKGTTYTVSEVEAVITTYVADNPTHVDSVFLGTVMSRIIAQFSILFPIGLLISALAIIAGVSYLCCAAGHRYPEEKPAVCWFDKIPFEIFIAAGVFLIYMLISGYMVTVYDIGHVISYYNIRMLELAIILVAVPLSSGLFLALGSMTFAARVKTGTLWKYTILGFVVRILIAIFKAAVELIRNIPLYWKVIVMYLAVMFVEGFTFLTARQSGLSEFVWFVCHIFLAVVTFIWALGFAKIRRYSKKVSDGDLNAKIDKDMLFGELKKTADDLEGLGEGVKKAVDERMRSERLKTELITNVSHDLKTPLTSIVNYVDILSKDEIESEEAKEHIEVLKRQAGKMKKLIEDLVEVSKATSGNVAVNLERTDVNLLLTQTVAEYAERFEECGLEAVVKIPEDKMTALLDGRLMWRVLDNLMGNICKYALAKTRVYISAEDMGETVKATFRNISRYPLSISGEELAERFVRGDQSRNTEGSGLGLSIAKSLCDLQNVGFEITIDGDLFKVELTILKSGDGAILEDKPPEDPAESGEENCRENDAL